RTGDLGAGPTGGGLSGGDNDTRGNWCLTGPGLVPPAGHVAVVVRLRPQPPPPSLSLFVEVAGNFGGESGEWIDGDRPPPPVPAELRRLFAADDDERSSGSVPAVPD